MQISWRLLVSMAPLVGLKRLFFGASRELVRRITLTSEVSLLIRSDLCGALISEDVTLIPVESWVSDIAIFSGHSVGFDTYANYAVFLCAQCVAYLKNRGRIPHEASLGRWVELIDLLDDWYSQRPEEMKSILTIPAVQGNDQSPFPTVFYANGPAGTTTDIIYPKHLTIFSFW